MSYVVDKNGVKLPDAIMVILYKGCKIMHSSTETLVYVGTQIRQCASIEAAIGEIDRAGAANVGNYAVSLEDIHRLKGSEIFDHMLETYISRITAEGIVIYGVSPADVDRCNEFLKSH